MDYYWTGTGYLETTSYSFRNPNRTGLKLGSLFNENKIVNQSIVLSFLTENYSMLMIVDENRKCMYNLPYQTKVFYGIWQSLNMVFTVKKT
jgi:hypothetical protein